MGRQAYNLAGVFTLSGATRRMILPSGPIGLPFVVEDSTRFEEIFGTDQTLAWDAQAHQMLLAQTPPSVRTYLRNGGTRCWVIWCAAPPHP